MCEKSGHLLCEEICKNKELQCNRFQNCKNSHDENNCPFDLYTNYTGCSVPIIDRVDIIKAPL